MHSRICQVAGLALGLLSASAEISGQTLDHVDVFRDAVVTTWKAEARSGPCAVALSFHASRPSDVLVFAADTEGPRGGVQAEASDWFRAGGQAAWEKADGELEDAVLELALKNAQFQLVEEDLALLRANRKVGGTSEALLVEDLAEVADFMHEEVKDLLYRRVELTSEIEAKEKQMEVLRAARAEWAPRQVQQWTVEMPEGASGALWTQVVEWGPAQCWTPADVLTLNSGTQPGLTWSQRADAAMDLPVWDAAVSVRFHDAAYRGLDSRPDAVPEMLTAAYAQPRKGAQVMEAEAESASDWPGVLWQVDGLAVGADWQRNVGLQQQQLPVAVRHYAVPKQSPVVNMRLSVPLPGLPVAEMEKALLMIDDRPAGKVWVSQRGDSLVVDAGGVRDWTVERSRESALCSKSNLGNRVKHHRAYTITATNRSGIAGELVIEEPLPVSRSAEIEVAPESLGGGVLNEGNGIVRWQLRLAAGESRTLQFAYDLSHSRDEPVPVFD